MEDTIGKIHSLCQRSIAEGDFSYDHNEELKIICTVLRKNTHFDIWVPQLFELFEEFDQSVDLTFGGPGPLVHAMETTSPMYEEYLIASLARKPTSIGVWMADRISNSPGKDKNFWLQKINDVLNHPEATAEVKEMANDG